MQEYKRGQSFGLGTQNAKLLPILSLLNPTNAKYNFLGNCLFLNKGSRKKSS